MNGVDEIWVAVVGEWVSNELAFLDIGLTSSSESALWIGNQHQSLSVIVLEVGAKDDLRLQVGWRLVDAWLGDGWLFVVEDFNLTLGKLSWVLY